MPTLLQEDVSLQRPLAEDESLDQAALSALREFFLILDAWDRAEDKKLSPDMRTPVDSLSR